MKKIFLLTTASIFFVLLSLKAQQSTPIEKQISPETKNASTQTNTTKIEQKLIFTVDARVRIEDDWGVVGADGKTADARLRVPVRIRFGLTYNYDDNISFGTRLRTGAINNQQSEDYTLGSAPGEFSTVPLDMDRMYIRYSKNNFTAWGGKNLFPFYTHDELFWSQNVSPEGFYADYEIKINAHFKLKPSGGYFIAITNGSPFNTDKTLKAFQILANYKTPTKEFNIATGIYKSDSLGNTPDGTATFLVNYAISVTSAKFTFNTKKLPLSIAGNFMYNFAELNNPTIIANNHQNQNTAYSATLEYGQLKNAHDFIISATYAHTEKYAIVDYFATDAWLRWGFTGATGTRSSNYEGIELRAGYAFGPKYNLLARAYFVNGIAPNKPGATLESNNRFRLDFNVGF